MHRPEKVGVFSTLDLYLVLRLGGGGGGTDGFQNGQPSSSCSGSGPPFNYFDCVASEEAKGLQTLSISHRKESKSVVVTPFEVGIGHHNVSLQGRVTG